MDMMKALLGLEEHRIRFMTGEGDYEGTISKIAPEIELLIIRKLVWLPQNTKFHILTFRASEIKSFEILGRSESPIPKAFLYDNPTRFVQDTQVHTLLDDLYDETFSDNESELYAEMYPEEKEYELNLPPMLSNSLPIDNVIIEKLDAEFYDAISYLSQQATIGISLESAKINRYEDLHWLCISSECCTFLFDIYTLGKLAFPEGLKGILENSEIEKVIYDCRQASDCLFHQFNTRLINVFDIQVADYLISQQRRRKGKLTTHVSPLNSCLYQYLDVPNEFLYRRKERSYQDDLVFYSLRPIDDDLRDFFIKNVIYLRSLKEKMDEALLEPMERSVQVYLSSIQNKTDRELKLETFKPNKVPIELLRSEIQIFRFRDYIDVPNIMSSGPPYRKMTDSFKDYITYCEKYNIGAVNKVENKKPVLKDQFSNRVNSSGFECKKSCDGTCVVFVNGKMSMCHNNRKDESSRKESESSKEDSASSDSEDVWAEFRKAFAATGPTRDGRKLVFVPAGMDYY